MMNTPAYIRKFVTAYKILVRPTLHKIYNTIDYLFTPKSKRLVLNGWFRHCGRTLLPNNWGDDINFYVIPILTGKKIFNYSSIYRWIMASDENNYTCIGSLIDMFPDKKTVVWGSGVLCGDGPLKNIPEKILAVRGPESRKYLIDKGISCPEVFGDPALLLPLIYKPVVQKKYKLGVIPILADVRNPLVDRLINIGNGSVKFINMTDYGDWKSVIDDICSCDAIVSSSLHGLIVADAYGIPNARVKFSDSATGGDFKYDDYFESVSRCKKVPTLVTFETEISELLSLCSDWQPISFNHKPLLDSCPFELLKNFY